MMPITQDQFNAFHRIDKELFTVLTIVLCRDPMESMQVMALWLLLESYNFKDVVHKMLSLPGTIICALVEETRTCLSVVNNEPLAAEDMEIPLLNLFMENGISLQLFQENRQKIVRGIVDMMITVCQRAFPEITQRAVEMNTVQGHQAPTLSEEEKRSLFITFSRGNPVPELPLWDYISLTCGDNAIESMLMQQVEDNRQPLYAKVIFRKQTTVENILQGRNWVRFVIGENPVWARKLVPARG